MKRKPTNIRTDTAFRRTVRTFYRKHGRHDLPWRKTANPYRILVSEVMLQQTQVPRVREKYTAFIKQFPTVHALAAAPLGEVLRAWQGLGYNRRAKMLHECAKVVKGRLPKTYDELCSLPGIGPYTASAVMVFAYNEPIVMIETNIKTVYLHHYFNNKKNVPDSALLPIIEQTLDRKNPREWYAALMDYGTHLKKEFGNANVRSKHYTKQSAFKGSDREIRGAILNVLSARKCTQDALHTALKQFERERINTNLAALAHEDMVEQKGSLYRLPE
ncbi:MAG: A/G-specific adenine glycosylase [Candidatus Paceibacterota bacterium]